MADLVWRRECRPNIAAAREQKIMPFTLFKVPKIAEMGGGDSFGTVRDSVVMKRWSVRFNEQLEWNKRVRSTETTELKHLWKILYTVRFWCFSDLNKWPTWHTNLLFYNTFITVLYIFRATSCSSSGGQILLIISLWVLSQPVHRPVTYRKWRYQVLY